MATPTPSPSSVADVERLVERVHAGAVGGVHRMQRLDRERHARGAGVRQDARRCRPPPSRGRRRCPCEPVGKPPTTSTRQSAPSAAASSMARRLSSIAAARASGSPAGNMPPRQSPVTRRPLSCDDARRLPSSADRARSGRARARCARDAVPQAGLDGLRHGPLLAHGGEIDGQALDAHGVVDLRAAQRDAADGEQPLHAVRREIGVAQHPRLVGEPEQLGKMDEGAGALLAADHDEMVLQAVEIGEEDDAGLVEAGRRLEDVARERHGRRQDGVEARLVALRPSARQRRPRRPARWRRRCRAARRNSPARRRRSARHS